MNAKWATGRDLETAVEDFAAELAEVAYRLVLRNSPVGNWLDLRLELWRVLKEVVGTWAQHWPKADGAWGS
jgi:hypothetical protein